MKILTVQNPSHPRVKEKGRKGRRSYSPNCTHENGAQKRLTRFVVAWYGI